ncbi:MAG TPA: hypothetical protein VF316_17505 [Polyangiaceae bacterium]
MQVNVLACAQCGAPLPPTAVTEGVVSCPFCHATLNVVVSPTDDPRGPRAKEQAEAREAFARLVPVLRALQAASDEDDLYETLRAALKDDDGFARATFALVHDYDREQGSELRKRRDVIGSVAKDLMSLMKDLPPDGRELDAALRPGRLKRTITPAIYAELSARSPVWVAPAPPEPKKKKWFFF